MYQDILYVETVLGGKKMEKNETIGMDEKEIAQVSDKVNEVVVFITDMAKKMYDELEYDDLNYLPMLSNNLALSFITNFSVRIGQVSAEFVKKASEVISEEKKKHDENIKPPSRGVAI